MARLSLDKVQQIIAEWKAGKSQNKLAKDFGVSPATINKHCKDVPQENVELVNTQTLINTELAGKTECEVNAIHKVVDERTKHLIYFQNSALRNQELANNVLEDGSKKKGEDSLSIVTIEAHARTTARNKETVLGKQPDTAIQINNNQAPQKIERIIVDANSPD